MKSNCDTVWHNYGTAFNFFSESRFLSLPIIPHTVPLVKFSISHYCQFVFLSFLITNTYMLHYLGKGRGKETETEQSPGYEVSSLLEKVWSESELNTL